MGAVVRMPEPVERFGTARRVLRSPDSTVEQIDAALEVLGRSTDWMDIDLCRKFREARRATQGPTRRLSDGEMAEVMGRAPRRPEPKSAPSPEAIVWAFVLGFSVALLISTVFLAWTHGHNAARLDREFSEQ